MLRNYYYLNRTVVELNRILSGAVVDEIYSQEKNSLLISIPSNENPYRHLFISTNPSLPYLVIKNDHRKAKKNVVQINVLKKVEEISKVEISKNDRLIKISLQKLTIIFSIMGGRTNVYFIRNSEVITELRKSKGDSGILERVAKNEFTSQNIYHEIDEYLFEEFDVRIIKKEYSFIPKEIILEMKFRFAEGDSHKKLFHQLLKELHNSKIKVFENETEEKLRFVPETYRIFPTDDTIIFNDCNSAISKFLQKHYRFDRINKLRKEIKELRYEYINVKTKLLQIEKQSQIAKTLEKRGIKKNNQPVKILEVK